MRIKAVRPPKKRLNQDQRRDILFMRRLGYNYLTIAKYLGVAVSSVSYTVQKGTAEPKHYLSGRRTRFPPDVVGHILSYFGTYLEREKRAGKDRRTGKRNMKLLNYSMIREECIDGRVDFKVTNIAIKKLLKANGLRIGQEMSELRRKDASLREKRKYLLRNAERKQREAAAAAAGRAAEDLEIQVYILFFSSLSRVRPIQF